MRIYTNSKIVHTCVQCGAQSLRKPSKAMRRFCSRPCWDAWYRAQTIAEFWSHVDKSGDCWLWLRATSWQGYGMSSVGKTHRHAWVESSGKPIPPSLRVLHTCDVRACVRNDEQGVYTVDGIDYPRFGHLYLAPQKINLRDMVEKRRAAWQRVR